MNKHIILTGFMGSGKSAIGRILAERLKRPFLDMDSEIEKRCSLTVSEIFEKLGEETFRDEEAKLVRELCRKRGWIIATGGGTLLRPENRHALEKSGRIICLFASEEELIRRLKGGEGRPLLFEKGVENRAKELLAERSQIYQQVPWKIDTTGLTSAQAAEKILAGIAKPPLK
ncbi:MAG: shikimate kinase [Armatimonadetes bacterium]|nr:shikimate kinase [Armatimonadota bacterium]